MNVEHVPAEIFSPGEFIREEIETRDWTQEDLAVILGRSPRLVNEVIMGKRRITPDTAKALAAAFGTSDRLWMNLESMYRLSLAHNKDTNTVKRRARLFSLAPINEMVKRGWLEPSKNVALLEQRLEVFFDASNLDSTPAFYAAARKSTPYDTDTPAQTAWLFRVRQLVGTMSTGRYSQRTHLELIKDLRDLASSPEDIRRVPKLLAEAGIRFLVVEPLKGSRIDGVCFWLSSESPVIALSMRYNRIDYFWYTLMHELAHVRNQDGLVNSNAAIDTKAEDSRDDKPTHEEEADRVAAEALIPRDDLEDFIQRVGPLYSLRAIRGFAANTGIHPGVVVGQLQHAGKLTYSQFRTLLVPVRDFITSSALTDGWGHIVPAPLN